MAKAILVMDMPESCFGCNFLYCDGDTNLDSCQAREKARPVDSETYKNEHEKQEIEKWKMTH